VRLLFYYANHPQFQVNINEILVNGDKAMTELVLKVDKNLAERFKKISLQKFQGDESLAFELALKSLLSEDELDMIRLEQIVEQIQDEIKNTGGVKAKEIDAYIAAYRRNKRMSGAKLKPSLIRMSSLRH
jgi:hypothetical protein